MVIGNIYDNLGRGGGGTGKNTISDHTYLPLVTMKTPYKLAISDHNKIYLEDKHFKGNKNYNNRCNHSKYIWEHTIKMHIFLNRKIFLVC